MKYYKVIIFGLILYSSFMLIQVFTVEGYNGLKFLSFYMFVAAWFVAWWMGWLYPQADGSDIKKLKKGHLFISVYFILLFPMAFGLNQKFAILFFDVDEYAAELKSAKVIMDGGVKSNLNRFSGTDVFPVMKVANSNEGGIPTCNLLLLNDCEYGYKKGESFDIKFVNNLGYPLKYRTLIFEIKSALLHKGLKG